MFEVEIPVDQDRRFRKGILELCALNGGQRALWHLRNSLANGPSRGGYGESARHFGKEFDVKLKLTAPIVEACEISLPGFRRWLNATGFGNDKTMIKAFICWAEFTLGKGKVLTDVGDKALH